MGFIFSPLCLLTGEFSNHRSCIVEIAYRIFFFFFIGTLVGFKETVIALGRFILDHFHNVIQSIVREPIGFLCYTVSPTGLGATDRDLVPHGLVVEVALVILSRLYYICVPLDDEIDSAPDFALPDDIVALRDKFILNDFCTELVIVA